MHRWCALTTWTTAVMSSGLRNQGVFTSKPAEKVPELFMRITTYQESKRKWVTGSDSEITGNFHISFMDVCLIMIFLNLDFWVFLVFPISHNNITLYSECRGKRNLHLMGYRLESQESCVGWLGSREASSSPW